jgi:hypothetical protein
MSRLSLNLTFNNRSRNHNEFELWSPLPPFLDHLVNQTTLIVLLMVVIMLNADISASSAVMPPISDETVLSTPVEPVTRLHLDMHHEHVEDEFMMTVFVDIMT